MTKQIRERIGIILRTFREKTGKNQTSIAEQAGISPSMLSQIERGFVSPSIETLLDVCGALGLDSAEVFSRISSDRAPTIYRAGERLKTSREGIRYEQLATLHDSPVSAEMSLIELSPGHRAGPWDRGHEGAEMGYVLEGDAVLEFGDETLTLSRGDSISFNSRIPHRLYNPGPGEFKAVWYVSPPHQDYLNV
jgi:transcriptional regulator with XRE-family HTH domain